jgi:RimJ/RimL family protein N-acetyltransferase
MSLRVDPLPRIAGRVLLRRMRAPDLPAFHAYRQDPVVGRYQGWSPMSESEAAAFIDEMSDAGLFLPDRWVQLAIARADDDLLVGDVGLFVANDAEYAEIGFTVSPAAQGLGYGSAAAAAAIRLLLEETAVPRVIAVTDARNIPSIRVLESAGMSRVESRETFFKGEQCTEWIYARRR